MSNQASVVINACNRNEPVSNVQESFETRRFGM